jgi:hypothetical protein
MELGVSAAVRRGIAVPGRTLNSREPPGTACRDPIRAPRIERRQPQPLRSRFGLIGGSDDEIVDRWLDVLPRYARLQQSFAGSAEVALRAGVPDHSSQSLVAGLRRLASSSSRADELLALDLTPLAETLDSSGIPATVEHGDLHDGNVFVDAAGRVSVIDWGDAAIGHPFLSLQAVQWLGMGLNWERDDVRLDAVRDV